MAKSQIRRRALPRPAGNKSWYDYAGVLIAVSVLLSITTWSYGRLLWGLARAWWTNDDYSAGQLVPLAALFLTWRERKALGQCSLAPCWCGIGLILLSQAART
jgi:hypothetical protein